MSLVPWYGPRSRSIYWNVQFEFEDHHPRLDDGGRAGDLAMKSFLLFFGLGSAALYTLLVIADNVIANDMTENALVGQISGQSSSCSTLELLGPIPS